MVLEMIESSISNLLLSTDENSAEAYKKAFEDVKKYTPPFYVKRKAGFEFI